MSLALCAGNQSVTGGFPSQRPVTQSFDVFLWSVPEQTVEPTIETQVIWNAIALFMTSLWGENSLWIDTVVKTAKVVFPLPETMLTYCQLDPQEQISMKFYRKNRFCIKKNAFENVMCKMSAILL